MKNDCPESFNLFSIVWLLVSENKRLSRDVAFLKTKL